MSTINISYLIPRIVRHFMPEQVTRFLLLRSLIIKPGLETADPQAAVSRYVEILEGRGDTLKDRRVLVFGYGGRYDIGIGLLAAGAGKVILYDKYAGPDEPHNALFVQNYPEYLWFDQGRTRTRPEYLTVIKGDISQLKPTKAFPQVDLIISNSVYEHLNEAEPITKALADLTRPDGKQIHFIDLRDHFFRFPFEMLTFSDKVWRGWLNPTSNHNRLRIWDYRRIFDKYFGDVEIKILQRDESAFLKIRKSIRAEFISGNIQEDAVTLVMILASLPGKQEEP